YHLPVLERLLADPRATALYLFPTKALAQDQRQGLERWAALAPELGPALVAGVYDGDTTQHTRKQLRSEARLILSNPDMLHAGILPYHSRWSRFFGALAAVVVDEIHVYRGIFGSHVANVLRRLLRIAAHYGAHPLLIATSATIGNAVEHAERLTGRRFAAATEDGSPKGRKWVAFWNPAPLDPAGTTRRSANLEAARHLSELIARGIPSIAFAKSRVAAELVYRYTAERLEHRGGGLVERLVAYRAGYLPAERRAIEQRLFAGELLGVVATSALELGIDIGSLDAAVLVGFPPTVASAWQQIGRAGRGRQESLALIIAHEDPLEQLIMRRPEHFFGRDPECAVIDPDNPYVLAGHLGCAAHELPLADPELAESEFGPLAGDVAEALVESGKLALFAARRFWSSPELPARAVSLRTISDDTYTIVENGLDARVVGTVDAVSGLELVYPEAVYLHDGESYVVRKLDLEQKVAIVEPMAVDYYTQPVLDNALVVLGEEKRRAWGRPDAGRAPAACPPEGIAGGEAPLLAFGQLNVSWQTVGMKKVQFRTRDAIGYHPLDLPRITLPTRGCWLWIGERILAAVSRDESPYPALAGLRNLLVTVLPLHAMCDPADLGGIIDSRNLGRPCLFLFDRYPGGLGFAEQGYLRAESILESAAELVQGCPCADGCPSCVALPILHPAQQQDPDLGHGRPIPSKQRTLDLIARLQAAARDPG
ncbi:MAG TPA: Zn-binding domain-containing protein, partial [Candidatus Udaeobacter sp.]|nr:Zn-binding domain-containing protein [Candidatus Udaeobacter sp.]